LDKLIFSFQGGGVCWDSSSTSQATCRLPLSIQQPYGIYDNTNSLNKFSDYTIIHVLYCSGDLHIGDVTRNYSYNGNTVIQSGYNNFCYNTSCNVNYHNKYENRHECGEAISKAQIESQNMPNQIGYWTKKGYTEEQAKALVSERQTINSIESIMKREKCDITEATDKRKEITKKWLDSFPKQNYSNVSQELFWHIHESIKNDYKEIQFATILNGNKVADGKNYEYRVKTCTTVRSLDFYVKDVNRVIEFNGAYWHSINSKDVNYTPERDIKRNEEIMKTLNCDLMVINELDYYKDKSKVIEECINFIKNGN
jgi:hypothetical protein